MSAGPFLIDRAFSWFWPAARRWLDNFPHRRTALVWLMVGGVFWAGFRAWEEEHDARIAAEQHVDITVPPFERSLNEKQRNIIRTQVLLGAKVTIIPLMPGEPEDFARSIATALSDAHAEVSVSTGNMIMNGQDGLMVLFDHGNSISKSIFEALYLASLSPKDIGDSQGERTVLIKIGPKPRL